MPIKTDIAIALEQLRQQSLDYNIAQRYYDGDHQLRFATKRFREVFGGLFQEFADNLCPLAVDPLADRLRVVGFQLESDELPGEEPDDVADEVSEDDKKSARRISRLVWRIWNDNRMDQQATTVHHQALLKGDAYVMVWPSRQDPKRPRIYPQMAAETTVLYDDEDPGVIRWGAKCWRTTDGYLRLNMYYPDRIERYRSKKSEQGDILIATYPTSVSAFAPYSPDDQGSIVSNPFGRVPIFHFANNAPVGDFGVSELKDVIPIQDALNKSVMDMLVGMEFAALPQRWATGIEAPPERDRNRPRADNDPYVPGVDRLWAIEDPQGKFGQFPGTDLTQYLEVQDSFRLEMARVAGIPLHYLMMVRGQVSSGEAVKVMDERFTSKGERRQSAFGNVWEDALAFAMKILGEKEEIRLSARWRAIRSRSEKEFIDTLFVKKDLGVPRSQLLKEADYTEEQIQVFLAEWEEEKRKEQEMAIQGAINRAKEIPPKRGAPSPASSAAKRRPQEGAGQVIRERTK